MPDDRAVDFIGLDYKTSARHRPRFAAPFHGHTHREVDGPRALRLEMKEVARFDNSSIDLAVKRVVQSLDPAREVFSYTRAILSFPAAVVHDGHQPEYLMRSRTPGVLGFRFDRNLALRWPAISKAVEMLLGQVDLYDTFTGLGQKSFVDPFRANVQALQCSCFLHAR